MKEQQNFENFEETERMDVKPPPGAKRITLMDVYKQFPIDHIEDVQKEVATLTENEFINTSYILSTSEGIAQETAVMGMAELIRRGGANKNTPLNFCINIRCPEQNYNVPIIKQRVLTSLKAATQNKKTLRALANYMAPQIIEMGLSSLEQYPTRDFSGDLARKINTRLIFRKEAPLTKKERVGCASYAQYIPNLDELTGSNRLSSLLAEDLQIRRSKEGKNPTERKSIKTKKSAQKPKNKEGK